jgi:hypothetical protein
VKREALLSLRESLDEGETPALRERLAESKNPLSLRERGRG